LALLDSIIHILRLTSLDYDDSLASKSRPCSVPGVHPTSFQGHRGGPRYPLVTGTPSDPAAYLDHCLQLNASKGIPSGCFCLSFTLGSQSPPSRENTPLWWFTPAWPTSLDGDVRKESCRRLCWSAIALAAGHTSYSSASRLKSPTLLMANPANVCMVSILRLMIVCSMMAFFSTLFCLRDSQSCLRHSPTVRKIRFGRCTIERFCCGIVVCTE
jgi:hypothetical protein